MAQDVKIRSLMGTECTLSLNTMAEAIDGKIHLEIRWEVSRYRQTLLHHNVVLKDHLSLEEAGISHGDTLTLVVMIRAAPLGLVGSTLSSSSSDED